MKITESFFPSLSLSELFSSLGGVLGLWLGLGVMQLLEYGAKCADKLKKLISNGKQIYKHKATQDPNAPPPERP